MFSNNEDWFAELRCRNTRGGVIDHELDRVAAAPYVAAQVTGDMDRDTAGLGEKMAERRLRGAKGDRRQSSAVERIGQDAAQMTAADRLAMRDADGRKNKTRLRVGGAERGQLFELRD